MRPASRLRKDLLILLLTIAPIAAVYALPADTSLEEVRKAGVLTACVPSDFPPLAVPGSADPGFDVALLGEISKRIGVELSLNVNPSIGRDFNPRNWGITRAGCEAIAGGIVISPVTRSFLETLPTGIDTGWAVLTKAPGPLKAGMKVGVYPGFGGLDRVALTRLLRQHGLVASLAASTDALAAGLRSGSIDAGVTESFGARTLVKEHPELAIAWLPGAQSRAPLGIGLWKGDLTLKQAIAGALADMERAGTVQALETRYAILPITATASFAN